MRELTKYSSAFKRFVVAYKEFLATNPLMSHITPIWYMDEVTDTLYDVTKVCCLVKI
jgi:hypothetical protein